MEQQLGRSKCVRLTYVIKLNLGSDRYKRGSQLTYSYVLVLSRGASDLFLLGVMGKQNILVCSCRFCGKSLALILLADFGIDI